jgi:hypothetical protein
MVEAIRRMYLDMVKVASPITGETAVYKLPSFELYTVYVGVVLHVKVGDRSNKSQWEEELQLLVASIRLSERKWKIAGT